MLIKGNAGLNLLYTAGYLRPGSSNHDLSMAFNKISILPQGALRHAAIACAAIVAGSTLFFLQGHSASRSAQLAVLMLPGVLALLWPLPSARGHLLRTVFVTLWTGMFLLDGAVRSYMLGAYGAAPDSSFVIGAVANTNWREGSEYARTFAPTIAGWTIALCMALAGAAWLAAHGNRRTRVPRLAAQVLVALLCVSVLAHAFKPWRRLQPAVFWSGWTQSVAGMRGEWDRYDGVRARARALAEGARPAVKGDGPSTVVLVLSDSVNRDNMSLYGYGRATTPALAALKHKLGDDMLVIRNAWAGEATTLPALNEMFALDQGNDGGEDLHLLALARAAGYRTWWISNHDDIGIEQQHARLADVATTTNRNPGRSGGGLDEVITDDVQAALADGAPRKFIVVHLLGAHPYYKLRYPAGADAFAAADAVDAGLAAAGRSWRVGALRKEYDAAIRYHDTVVSRILGLVQASAAPQPEGNVAWMYLSDHGQEVGHDADFAGHSPGTPAGYRIPALVWRNRPWPAAAELANRSFRADWAGWTLADLLQLQWQGQATRYNVLAADYAWNESRLPGPVARAIPD